MGEQQETTALSSLEVPTMVNAGGSPVMAIIENLNASECRMRSVNTFAIGARVAFALTIHGAPSVPLEGTIASIKQNGPRFSYVVSLHTTLMQRDAITRAVDVARSRAAHAADVKTENGLTRASVRVPVNVEIRYAQPGKPAQTARALNISTGGLYMNVLDEIPVGTTLELDIPLGATRVKVHGRVVAHQAATPNYNIAFFEITHEAREGIAHFIDRQT
jgi:hypothetical protein